MSEKPSENALRRKRGIGLVGIGSLRDHRWGEALVLVGRGGLGPPWTLNRSSQLEWLELEVKGFRMDQYQQESAQILRHDRRTPVFQQHMNGLIHDRSR